MMKVKKTAVKKIAAMVGIFGTVLAGTAITAMAYAGDDTWEPPDPSTRADVTINVTSPEWFSDYLEFYCGAETFYIYKELGQTYTQATYNVPKGVNKIDFLDPNDLYGAFDITYPEWLDTDKQTTIDIVVDYSDKVKEDTEAEGDDWYTVEETEIQPLVYDFSNGGEYGTISVACKFYASVDSVVYRLMGDKIYEIELTPENDFKAEVLLPAGITYKEITNITVVPDEMATVAEGGSFSWGHRDNPAYFGNNYEVTTGSHTDVTDLYLNMHYAGEMQEVNDLILLGPKVYMQHTEQVDARRDEFVKAHDAAAQNPPEDVQSMSETVPDGSETAQKPSETMDVSESTQKQSEAAAMPESTREVTETESSESVDERLAASSGQTDPQEETGETTGIVQGETDQTAAESSQEPEESQSFITNVLHRIWEWLVS